MRQPNSAAVWPVGHWRTIRSIGTTSAAAWAGRAWAHNAATFRKPPDHHVQEAADDEAEEKANPLEKPRREHGVIVQGHGLEAARMPEPDM